MSVLVNKDSNIIVQGFTGSEGTFHAEQMIEYGTNVVGGVTPGKGGQEHLGKPVFNTVEDAVKEVGADTTIIFVPPAFAADAIMEAADAGIKVIITITAMDLVFATSEIKDVVISIPTEEFVISGITVDEVTTIQSECRFDPCWQGRHIVTAICTNINSAVGFNACDIKLL